MWEVPSVRQVMYTHAAITCVDLRPRVRFLGGDSKGLNKWHKIGPINKPINHPRVNQCEEVLL